MKLYILLCIITITNTVKSQNVTRGAVADRIGNLSGLLTPLSSAQYSGYLSGATDGVQLHYWFFEATENKETAPLLLWLNGGPGCSSLSGLLTEHGPYRLVSNNSVELHPHAWNRFSNIIYLETPAGVGYSYTKSGVLESSDDLSSIHSYFALLNFIRRFPEYRGRDFYITGQSYAGVYVPTLALRILSHPSDAINLKGIAVGNPSVHRNINTNSMFYYMYYHGLVDQISWEYALNNCCGSQCTDRCNFVATEDATCIETLLSMYDKVKGIDPYSIYSPCDGGVSPSGNTTKRRYSTELRELLWWTTKTTKFLRQEMKEEEEEEEQPDYLPCHSVTEIQSFMNDPSVRSALNIPNEAPARWEVCNDEIFESYNRQYLDLSEQYLGILDAGIPIMLYSGDTDMVCNVVGLQWFIDDLQLRVDESLKPWFYTADDGTEQVAGMVQEHHRGNNTLTFVTFRGSGHSVPTDNPVAAEHMITSFIRGDQL